jgi:hypothetical protein
MLLKDLYSKWDNVGNFKDARIKSAIKHVNRVEIKEGSKV